jgi:hypothetical protein
LETAVLVSNHVQELG